MKISQLIFTAALAIALSSPLYAATHTVEMLSVDKSQNLTNRFKPILVRVNKGDTVKWVAKHSGHNVAFVKGPDGVAAFTSPFAKEITYKFDVPGLYLYKCTPHVGLGMVGIVMVANNRQNLAALKSAYVPPLAKKRLEPVFSELSR